MKLAGTLALSAGTLMASAGTPYRPTFTPVGNYGILTPHRLWTELFCAVLVCRKFRKWWGQWAYRWWYSASCTATVLAAACWTQSVSVVLSQFLQSVISARNFWPVTAMQTWSDNADSDSSNLTISITCDFHVIKILAICTALLVKGLVRWSRI